MYIKGVGQNALHRPAGRWKIEEESMSCTERQEEQLSTVFGDYWDGCASWPWDKDEEVQEAIREMHKLQPYMIEENVS